MPTIPTQLVSSGEHVIASDTPKLLTAILGSCVGVAITDKKNKKGGLLHLLLPEPPSVNPPHSPMVYATTGLPQFIDDILKAGAKKENLEAVVAGGALIGNVSPRDIALDIGGRTAEIVGNILVREGISVKESVTGGYFGGKLVLNTSSWEAQIIHVDDGIKQEQLEFSRPRLDEISHLIDNLRPVPQVVLKILRLIGKKNYDMKNVTDEVCQDQVISAKVLRYCNSMIIGMKDVDSLDRAVVMLGEAGLFEAVLSMTMDTYFLGEPGGYSLQKGGLHYHSLAVANCAKTIANHTERVNPTTAYTAGLLHDIGKIVLDQFVAKAAPLFYKTSLPQQKQFTDLENEILGTDHQQVGKKLAEKWQLAESLVESIEFHDSPEKAEKHPSLVHTVYLANLLATSFQAEADIETGNARELEGRLAAINLSATDLPLLISRVPWGKRI
jgi:putative nucleotidyltransferase with HDIG domain